MQAPKTTQQDEAKQEKTARLPPKACEYARENKRGICVWVYGKRGFPVPADKTGARSEAEGEGLGGVT